MVIHMILKLAKIACVAVQLFISKTVSLVYHDIALRYGFYTDTDTHRESFRVDVSNATYVTYANLSLTSFISLVTTTSLAKKVNR